MEDTFGVAACPTGYGDGCYVGTGKLPVGAHCIPDGFEFGYAHCVPQRRGCAITEADLDAHRVSHVSPDTLADSNSHSNPSAGASLAA